MKIILDFLANSGNLVLAYTVMFAVGSVVLFYLANLKSESAVVLNTLQVIKIVLSAKLGSKADAIIGIWIEGLKKIQDGEFSKDDGIDQFIRFVRLGASSKGVNLTDEDVEHVKVLVGSTLDIFLGKKHQSLDSGVNKFKAMNAVGVFTYKHN